MGSDTSTRQEILDAGYGVLIDDGYADFTTQAVADDAGVSQSLVHYYFDSKHDLVLTLFEEGIEYLDEQVEETMATDDPAERLRAFAEVMISNEEAGAVAFKRMLLELNAQAPHDEQLKGIVRFDRDQLLDYLVATVEDGIERGQFRDVDPEVFAATYLAAASGAQNWSAIFPDETDEHERALAGLEALVDDYLQR